MYTLYFSKRALKDRAYLKAAGLESNARELLELLTIDPFKNPPPYESLTGNLSGLYSRRINYQHRLVYAVSRDEKIVRIFRMWTHYDI